MSNFLAVATVTATLKNLLQSAIGKDEHDVQGVTVTTQRPDKEMPSPGVNIFLYQVTPNPYCRNTDLPTRNTSNGKLVQRPRMAIDLHYLITFYGEEGLLVPQRLLGSVIRTIHTYPVLTHKQIQDTIKMNQYNYLSESDLANEIYQVKFVPLNLSLEELSKLWSVFFQVDYALSIAYQASVVFIESQDTFAAPLPVRQPVITVVPFSYPKIVTVNPSRIPYEAGAPFTIGVSNLQAGDQSSVTQVTLGGNSLMPNPQQNDRLVVHLPANARAGINAVQVRQLIDVGNHQLRPGFESNIATLVIQPVVESVTYSQTNNSLVGQPPIQHFDVGVAPVVGVQQRVELMLNEFNPLPDSNTSPTMPLTFTIPGKSRLADSNLLTFETTGIPKGTYLVRVRIDGAESNLQFDTQQGSPMFNRPFKPTVEVL